MQDKPRFLQYNNFVHCYADNCHLTGVSLSLESVLLPLFLVFFSIYIRTEQLLAFFDYFFEFDIINIRLSLFGS